jgi:hypothetical protein
MKAFENRKNETGSALNEADLAGVCGGYPAAPEPQLPEKPNGAPLPRFPRLPALLRPIKPPPGTTPPILVVPTA